jgi:inhibitor of KinA sporulation pathway (predicted exonuclease)
MPDEDLTSMSSRRDLARGLDALLIDTASSYSRPPAAPELDIACAPVVRRIRSALVDQAVAVPPGTLAHVAAFLAFPQIELAARIAAELSNQPPKE